MKTRRRFIVGTAVIIAGILATIGILTIFNASEVISDEPIACGNVTPQKFFLTFPAQASEGAGYDTPEEAIEAEARYYVRQPDKQSQAVGENRYSVKRSGRVVAKLETIQLSNGRYVVRGGEVCPTDAPEQ